jgi:gluconolactonase
MKIEVFDTYRCELGEGPTSSGLDQTSIMWIDIISHKCFNRNILTGDTVSFSTPGEIGFALPRSQGGQVLGHASGATLRAIDGSEKKLPSWSDLGICPDIPVRWNDAKISPDGEIFMGTMAVDGSPDAGALFALDKNLKLRLLLEKVSISNGLDWSPDCKYFYYIDTLTYRVDIFNYSNSNIYDRRTFVELDRTVGMPDGMCIDAEGGLWIAFFGGSCLQRYTADGALDFVLPMPVKNPTSCSFAGKDLDSLIITSAKILDTENSQSGMTFIVNPGIKGKKSPSFQA